MRFVLTLALALSFTGMATLHPSAHAGEAVAISALELQEIVEEAQNRKHQLGDDWDNPNAPAWKSLNPEKLQQLLQSSQLQSLYYQQNGQLIDQAFAWDLVNFQNLNDIKRFFQRVADKDYFIEPSEDDSYAHGGPIRQRANANAGPSGAAISALLSCLPTATWVVEKDDPLLWDMQRGNTSAIAILSEFGTCVRKQRSDISTPNPGDPDTIRGAQSAAIIEDRLSRQLLTKGCSGTGPDQCLTLLRALLALNPLHKDRIAIIKRIEKDTKAMQAETIPEPLAAYKGRKDDPLRPLYEKTRHQLWRKGIVLSSKLELMLAQPTLWSEKELLRTVDASIALMLVWRRLDWLQDSNGVHRDFEFAIENPWQHLYVDDRMPDQISSRLQHLGTLAAAEKGCALAKLTRNKQADEYWYAYTVKKLKGEQQDCKALPMQWVAEHYMAASKQQQQSLLAPIADLGQWLDENAEPRLRDALRDGIESYCPEENFGADYWGICARKAALIKTERDTAEAERLAAEAEEKALEDDPCQNGTLDEFLQTAGYNDAEGNPLENVRVACTMLPDATETAVIAIFKLATPIQGGDTDSGDYDLHLLFINTAAEILAQGQFKNAAYSDAIRLDEVGVDTGLLVAPDLRALGVTTYNAAHCFQCIYSERKLSLFVRDGKKLHRVLDSLPQHLAAAENDQDAEGCIGAFSETSKTIAAESSIHAGFYDLRITTDTSHEPGYLMEENGDAICKNDLPPERSVERWIYDGQSYVPLISSGK